MEDYLGQDIPKLGFGLMRLPRIGEGESSTVDIDQVEAMVDAFLDAGYTYFDTARGYGDSEAAVRQALVERHPRESYQLATKLAAWLGAKDADDARAMFQTSLATTGAGYFDFYLLHNLGAGRTQVFEDYRLWDFVRDLKEQGLIRHYGFSFHDRADVLERILDEHPDAEFVQLQVNYADWNDPYVQSGKCYEVARSYGKPVIIMEPVKGGMLANPPAAVADIFHAADPKASCASWALRFAESLPGVITVLSGMSTIGQMEDNLATMKALRPLGDTDRDVIARAQETLADAGLIGCTGCSYCTKECPKNVSIPGIFNAVNNYRMFEDLEGAKRGYQWEASQGAPASACVECGKCEQACPQHLPIRDELKAAKALLE